MLYLELPWLESGAYLYEEKVLELLELFMRRLFKTIELLFVR